MATYLEDPLFTLSDDKETVEFMELVHSVGKVFAPEPSVGGIESAAVKGTSEGLRTGGSFSISCQLGFCAYAIWSCRRMSTGELAQDPSKEEERERVDLS